MRRFKPEGLNIVWMGKPDDIAASQADKILRATSSQEREALRPWLISALTGIRTNYGAQRIQHIINEWKAAGKSDEEIDAAIARHRSALGLQPHTPLSQIAMGRDPKDKTRGGYNVKDPKRPLAAGEGSHERTARILGVDPLFAPGAEAYYLDEADASTKQRLSQSKDVTRKLLDDWFPGVQEGMSRDQSEFLYAQALANQPKRQALIQEYMDEPPITHTEQSTLGNEFATNQGLAMPMTTSSPGKREKFFDVAAYLRNKPLPGQTDFLPPIPKPEHPPEPHLPPSGRLRSIKEKKAAARRIKRKQQGRARGGFTQEDISAFKRAGW